MHKNYHQQDINDPLAELRELLAAFSARELTKMQYVRIQRLAIESEASWRLYLQHMFMYGALHRKQCNRVNCKMPLERPLGYPGDDDPRDLDPPNEKMEESSPSSNRSIFPLLEIEKELLSSSDDTCGPQGIKKTNDNGTGWGFLGHINFSFVPWAITIVAGVLILSSIIILPFYWATRPPDPKWSVVARITKAIDCQWAQSEQQLQEETFLTVNQPFELEVGLVEIEFSSGAKVILQGPAQFMAIGHNDLRLDSGKLAAVVPEEAKGFKVRTAGMKVVDLGTEFGVAVDTNYKTDVHVFKGVVEMEADTQSIQLKQNEAVRYDKISDSVVSIPVNANRFVRDIDTPEGVTTKLRVINPSFEVPDIRTVPEYQADNGDTEGFPIYGWKPSNLNEVNSCAAKYQILPFDGIQAKRNVRTAATEGRQAVTLSLGKKGVRSDEPRSYWIYQSLGYITTADIGKKLKLSVDAGPRTKNVTPQGKGTVFAGFALHVTPEQAGAIVGDSDSFTQEGVIEHLHRLEAVAPISVELVGQELFILLGVCDDGSTKWEDEYHFDKVQVVVEK